MLFKNNMPFVFKKKSIITSLIGSGILLFGIIYYVSVDDIILLTLSILISFSSYFKAAYIYYIGFKEKYVRELVTCCQIKRSIGKYQKIIAENEQRQTRIFKLPKDKSFQPGNHYYFYFRIDQKLPDHTQFDNHLPLEFIAYESIDKM